MQIWRPNKKEGKARQDNADEGVRCEWGRIGNSGTRTSWARCGSSGALCLFSLSWYVYLYRQGHGHDMQTASAEGELGRCDYHDASSALLQGQKDDAERAAGLGVLFPASQPVGQQFAPLFSVSLFFSLFLSFYLDVSGRMQHAYSVHDTHNRELQQASGFLFFFLLFFFFLSVCLGVLAWTAIGKSDGCKQGIRICHFSYFSLRCYFCFILWLVYLLFSTGSSPRGLWDLVIVPFSLSCFFLTYSIIID
ncbi:hypothetical protein B0I35DRAFT_236973 [Stachybotrys elegans]|uniref:Transmembrane protein n=1 Tax=Stachybotrys elegans TaxID=80388 RepID=A0A8K0WQY6_9HYPO|nr:hypothetical protein B0I35DRAFT_236973 [Stachybotrys elegans]